MAAVRQYPCYLAPSERLLFAILHDGLAQNAFTKYRFSTSIIHAASEHAHNLLPIQSSAVWFQPNSPLSIPFLPPVTAKHSPFALWPTFSRSDPKRRRVCNPVRPINVNYISCAAAAGPFSLALHPRPNRLRVDPENTE